jgi:two-component system phosphate regulon sensor histidine kinase PhoR
MAAIARRAAAVAAFTMAPLVIAVEIWAPHGPMRWLAPVWGGLAILISFAAAHSLSRRAIDLARYVDQIPESPVSRPRLHFQDDELGDLARSLSRMAPKVEQVVQGLSTELARREAILASMTEAVVAVDAKLNVSFCNESFVRVAGHPITEEVPLIKVFRDPGLFQMLRQVISSGETYRQRLNISVLEDCWFEVYATPLAGSSPRGALAILHDITPMTRMERAQRDFVANVSHEFRTPLATISGCAETLIEGAWDDTENRRKFLEIIQANSVRLTNIAADLITLSQLDTVRSRPEPAPIHVEEVVSGALRAIRPVAGIHQVEVRAGEVCTAVVLGHRLAFEQALLNLLDNAVKFNRPSGEVIVRAKAAGDQVEISVADTGIGIPNEDLSRIFERFYRVDKARSRQIGGTGLGLSIVRQAVDQMHGTVRVESKPGKGSCFTITLPRHGASVSS